MNGFFCFFPLVVHSNQPGLLPFLSSVSQTYFYGKPAKDGNTEADRGQAILVDCCSPPYERSRVDYVITTLLKIDVA